MTWVRLDDQFLRNPKIVAAGRDARDLYIAGLCYSAGSLTDGRLPRNALRMLAADAGIDDADTALAALIREGLWDNDASGFIIHDFADYNPPAERVKAEREANARRQAEWRERKRAERDERRDTPGSNGTSNAVTNGPVTGAPSPSPIPEPGDSPPVVPPPNDAAGAARLSPPSSPRQPAREKPERTPRQQAADRLFERRNALYGAWCRGVGLDPDSEEAAIGRDTAFRQLKPIAETAVPAPDDFEACTRYLKSQQWRDDPPTIPQVVQGYGRWVAQDRPARASPRPISDHPPPRRRNGGMTPEEIAAYALELEAQGR